MKLIQLNADLVASEVMQLFCRRMGEHSTLINLGFLPPGDDRLIDSPLFNSVKTLVQWSQEGEGANSVGIAHHIGLVGSAMFGNMDSFVLRTIDSYVTSAPQGLIETYQEHNAPFPFSYPTEDWQLALGAAVARSQLVNAGRIGAIGLSLLSGLPLKESLDRLRLHHQATHPFLFKKDVALTLLNNNGIKNLA